MKKKEFFLILLYNFSCPSFLFRKFYHFLSSCLFLPVLLELFFDFFLAIWKAICFKVKYQMNWDSCHYSDLCMLSFFFFFCDLENNLKLFRFSFLLSLFHLFFFFVHFRLFSLLTFFPGLLVETR